MKKYSTASFGKQHPCSYHIAPPSKQTIIIDLGTSVNNEVFDHHVAKVVRKSFNLVQLISNGISSRSKDVILPLYSSLRPVIEYNAPLGIHLSRHRIPLEIHQ